MSADDVIQDLIRAEDDDNERTVFSLTTDGILLTQRQDKIQQSLTSTSDDGQSDRDGRWTRAGWGTLFDYLKKICKSAFSYCCRIRFPCSQATRMTKKKLGQAGSYAVVTFTSRQAAASARSCCIDGRGSSRWYVIHDLPVSPLSEAAPFDLKTCRNCCRPVTLSLNPGQKKIRKYVAVFCIFLIYTSYTIPIAWVSDLTSENIDTIFPDYNNLDIISGYLSGITLTIFLSVAPYLFKIISNFGSGAESLNAAERHTLKYYWFFQLSTCYTGSFLATIITNLFNFGNTGDLFYQSSAKETFARIATDLPTTSSAFWLNWLIVRTFSVIPLQYLLQFNAHLFRFIRMKCCSRLQQGGGMGGPLPFRVYVDSSVVLLCAITFSIVSPLVVPFALIYFATTIPLWRRQLLLVYRPMFDAGGMRWPFLFMAAMSALYLSIVLIAAILLLKNMFTPSIIAILAIIPAIDFHLSCNKRFKKAYSDIGLMQAGLINESDKKRGVLNSLSFDLEKFHEKENFRQWIVDAHLSAFIPVCMSDNKQLVDTLTAAPAQTFCQQNLADLNDECNITEPVGGGGVDDLGLGSYLSDDDSLSVCSSFSSTSSPTKFDEEKAIIQKRRKILQEKALVQGTSKTEKRRASKARRQLRRKKKEKEQPNGNQSPLI